MKKILLVDDDKVALCVLAEYLAEMHYTCVIAENGLQAWNLLQQAPTEFALIITDRVMPKMHGIELLTKLQEHTLLHKIPVVMMTGLVEKEEVLDAVAAGVSDFLYKPVTKDLLCAILKRLII